MMKKKPWNSKPEAYTQKMVTSHPAQQGKDRPRNIQFQFRGIRVQGGMAVQEAKEVPRKLKTLVVKRLMGNAR